MRAKTKIRLWDHHLQHDLTCEATIEKNGQERLVVINPPPQRRNPDWYMVSIDDEDRFVGIITCWKVARLRAHEERMEIHALDVSEHLRRAIKWTTPVPDGRTTAQEPRTPTNTPTPAPSRQPTQPKPGERQ